MTTAEKTFQVEGMTCGSCELTVREEVEELGFVDSVEADRTTGRVVVRGKQIDDEAVREAITSAGYKVAA